MEKITLCSHALYNNDILEKTERLKKYDNPQIKVKSMQDWYNKVDEMYSSIYDKIRECIVQDSNNYKTDDLLLYGFSSSKFCFFNIYSIIENELNNLTNNKYKSWCHNFSQTIVTNILECFNAFIQTFYDGHEEIEIMKNSIEQEKMVEFIINSFKNICNEKNNFYIHDNNTMCNTNIFYDIAYI